VNDDQVGTCLNQFDFSAGWSTATGGDQFQGDEHYTGTAGESYTFRFYGSRVLVYGTTDVHHGIATVSIDGGPEEEVDFYAAQRAVDVLLWTSPALVAGPHTLTVRATGRGGAASTGTVVTADRIDVHQSTPATMAGPHRTSLGVADAATDDAVSVFDIRGRTVRPPDGVTGALSPGVYLYGIAAARRLVTGERRSGHGCRATGEAP
jgi:hypothetical protein